MGCLTLRVCFMPENIKDYLRITIGTDEEMDKFFEVVDEYMEGHK